MKRIFAIAVLLTAVSCDPSGVKDPVKEKEDMPDLVDSNEVKVNELDVPHEVVDEKKIKHGIKIKWYEHGEGEQLSHGDVAHVDYKVELTNGEVIDGNHLINKDYVPFMIGFGMQTSGWDEALKELRVGDFAEVFIPAEMARGEQAVEGLFPANSDNILKIRIVERPKPDRSVDGSNVWVFEENKEVKEVFTEENTIEFHCMAFSESTPIFVNTYRTNTPFKMKLEDHGLVPGLKKALINAKKGDRMLVYVPSEEAYKTKGYQDIVKPNEDLMYNVLVLDVTEE